MSMDGVRALDVITIGRSSIDLYGTQIGARLEDVASFTKSVGGCPTNIAIGAARMGLRSAVITRVGDEQMGRFIREQAEREGVDVRGIKTDPERLTALVLLSVRDRDTFPLIFYRDNCADMALSEGDVEPDFIASARAVLVTGTHFSRPSTETAQRKAMKLARDSGGKVIFDVDFRPNLWGLAGHGAGELRYIASAEVSKRLTTVLAECDLIVGTEEELLIAAGEADIAAALRTIRARSAATIVLKRGPMGCIVYDGPIPDDLEGGIVGRGFPIEVYNVLGAGDAFMAGFLRGFLRGESHETSATWANASGALVVSRLLCSPEIPTFEELQYFLDHGSHHRALREDVNLNRVHRATTRRRAWPELMAFAIDHRSQLEEMAAAAGASTDRISAFKRLAVTATARVANGRHGYGMLLDDRYGKDALFEAEKLGLWIGRPVEKPGSRPLEFDGRRDLGSHLLEWPVDHCVKCLCLFHPDDDAVLRDRQIAQLLTVQEAARRVDRDLLVEIIASEQGPMNETTMARVLEELYRSGLEPDWWKLESQPSAAAWRRIAAVVEDNDPWCRGIVVLGLNAPLADLRASFVAPAATPLVKGFAVGRTIFADAARAWLTGEIGDGAAINLMAGRFGELCEAWREARREVAQS